MTQLPKVKTCDSLNALVGSQTAPQRCGTLIDICSEPRQRYEQQSTATAGYNPAAFVVQTWSTEKKSLVVIGKHRREKLTSSDQPQSVDRRGFRQFLKSIQTVLGNACGRGFVGYEPAALTD